MHCVQIQKARMSAAAKRDMKEMDYTATVLTRYRIGLLFLFPGHLNSFNRHFSIGNPKIARKDVHVKIISLSLRLRGGGGGLVHTFGPHLLMACFVFVY